MKHLLAILTIALAGAATTAFAAPLFDDPVFNGVSFNEVTTYTNQNNQGAGNGSYYTIRFNGSGDFYLTSLRTNRYSDDETLTNPIYGLTKYGYIDSEGVTHKFDFFNTDGTPSDNVVEFTSVIDNGSAFNGMNVTREGYYLGKFNAGDEIQVYVEGAVNGNNYWAATNSSQDGVYSSRYEGRTDLLNPAMSIGQLYFSEGSQMNFGVVASGATYTPGTSGGVVGSPLPGGLQIAIIAGLFGLGFYYVRRRKAAAV